MSQSEPIRANQSQSEPIRANQSQSETIRMPLYKMATG